MIDRRVPFFLVSALVCGALVPVADPAFRWVAEVTAALYVLLAVLVGLDWLGRSRASRRKRKAHRH